jgi:cell division protein FtsI/penicillin-binding protein 2
MFEDYGVHRRIQIPGQTWFAGRPIAAKRWGGKEGPNYTLPSVSFGQGFYMNPVRLAGNLAAFANDGRPVEPYLIEGQQVELDPICRPETARYVQDAMATMMDRQVHHNKILPDLGVEAAAKSGTSRNPTDHSKNTVLFAHLAPLAEPEVLVLAVVYNPDVTKVKSRYGPSGTRNAGPLATRVLGHALRIRGVLPPEVPQSLDSDSAPGSLEPGQSHR